jgi:hypothetical protein
MPPIAPFSCLVRRRGFEPWKLSPTATTLASAIFRQNQAAEQAEAGRKAERSFHARARTEVARLLEQGEDDKGAIIHHKRVAHQLSGRQSGLTPAVSQLA